MATIKIEPLPEGMPIHPACLMFPMLTLTRYAEFVENVRQYGQIEPITLYEGQILDGKIRYKACVDLGIEPIFRVYSGDPWAYAWSMNGVRGDLTGEEEQRYFIRKYLEEKRAAQVAQERP
ncbi:MAG TPA: hypothetical protein PLQ35_14455 [bacterium]|nr:hypothetical protein [bacterium]